ARLRTGQGEQDRKREIGRIMRGYSAREARRAHARKFTFAPPCASLGPSSGEVLCPNSPNLLLRPRSVLATWSSASCPLSTSSHFASRRAGSAAGFRGVRRFFCSPRSAA